MTTCCSLMSMVFVRNVNIHCAPADKCNPYYQHAKLDQERISPQKGSGMGIKVADYNGRHGGFFVLGIQCYL